MSIARWEALVTVKVSKNSPKLPQTPRKRARPSQLGGERPSSKKIRDRQERAEDRTSNFYE